MKVRNIQDFLPEVRDYYLIYEDGTIWNTRIDREAKQRYRAGTTYRIINLKLLNGSSKCFRVHRLVMMAFAPIDNPDCFEVNHIDGNKENNNFSNLEWCTSSENQLHAFRLGLQSPRRGVKNNLTKLSEDQVQRVFEMRKNNIRVEDIAKEVGCTKSNIYCILSGKSWKQVQNFND